MPGRSKQGGKGSAKTKRLGRRKAQIVHYYAYIYPLRKLRRILRHNGMAAAKEWAISRGRLPELMKVARQRGQEVQ